MRVFRRIEEWPGAPDRTAVAVGNFDGLHLGHLKIIRRLMRTARNRGLHDLILTFSPHPEYVLGKQPVRLIQTLEQRLSGFRRLGVRSVLVLPFDAGFSRISARGFAAGMLAGRLKAGEVVVGENFRFGRDRKGDVDFLRRLGERQGFGVTVVPPVKIDGRTVSSSLVRDRLKTGDLHEACLLLGRPYEIEGIVIRGQSLGRTLGFPTANLETENEILPGGVFITRAVLGRTSYPSLTNIGHCPTFGRRDLAVECHLIGFQRELYGRRLRIRFYKKIRDESDFGRPEALRRRIQADVEKARAYFGAGLRP